MKHFLLLKTLASPEPGIVTPTRNSLQVSFRSPEFRQIINKSVDNFNRSWSQKIKMFENPGSAPVMNRQPSFTGNGNIEYLIDVFSPKTPFSIHKKPDDLEKRLVTPRPLYSKPGKRDPRNWTQGMSVRQLKHRTDKSFEAEDAYLQRRIEFDKKFQSVYSPDVSLDHSVDSLPGVGDLLTPSSSLRKSVHNGKPIPFSLDPDSPQSGSLKRRPSIQRSKLMPPIIEEDEVPPRPRKESTDSTGSGSVNRAATSGVHDGEKTMDRKKRRASKQVDELRLIGRVPADKPPLRGASVPTLNIDGNNQGESVIDDAAPLKLRGVTTDGSGTEPKLDPSHVTLQSPRLSRGISSTSETVPEEPLIRLATDNGKIKIDDKSRSNIFDGTLTIDGVKNKLREIIGPTGTVFHDLDSQSIHDVLKTVYSQFDPSKNENLATKGYKGVDRKWINILPELAQVMDEVHRIIDADPTTYQDVKASMYSDSDPLAATSEFSKDQHSMTINGHKCSIEEQTNYNIAELLLTVFVAATTQRGSRGSFLPLAVLPSNIQENESYNIADLFLPTGLNQSELLINESKLITFMKEIKPGDDAAVMESNISATKRIAQLLDALSDQILQDKINYLRNVLEHLGTVNSDALTFITNNKDSVLEALSEWPDVKNALVAELDPNQKRVKSSRTFGNFAEAVRGNTSVDSIKPQRDLDLRDPGESSNGIHCGNVDDGVSPAPREDTTWDTDPYAMSQHAITAN